MRFGRPPWEMTDKRMGVGGRKKTDNGKMFQFSGINLL
jgi:hypothetical protein